MIDVTEIEKRVDRVVAAAIPITTSLGGINPENYGQMMEFAKTMATCRAGIPAWLRASVGDCLMICSRALRWGMDPYFVAEKSYLMEGKGGTKVGFESQLIHAVIEALAPIKGRLRHEYRGEGDDTVCVVWATFKGEDKPHEYISETLGKRIKDIGTNDRGNFRGSPNWLTKPRLQLFYDASRDWARVNCPDVLAGVYTHDELPDMEPVDVTPKVSDLSQRLKDANAKHATRGFDANAVATQAGSIIEGQANTGEAKQEAEHHEDAQGSASGRGDEASGGGDVSAGADLQSGRREAADGGDQQRDEKPASDDTESSQAEIFPPDRKPVKAKGKRR